MSHLYGVQTDNVLELKVVVADGRVLTCSAAQNADLFNALRAGLGQVGIITRATLNLMPAPARVRRCQLFYADQATLTADQRKVLNERQFQHIQGKFIPNGSAARSSKSRAASSIPDPCRTTTRYSTICRTLALPRSSPTYRTRNISTKRSD